MAKTRKTGEPVITIKVQKGLADRNRLPLADFLGILEECRQMIGLVGRRLQRERGTPLPTGDFGLEIVAGDNGSAVQPGSIWSPLAITSDSNIGILAAEELIRSLHRLEEGEGPIGVNSLDNDLIRRLSRLARIQERDKLELEVSMVGPSLPAPLKAKFGPSGIASMKALQSSTFEVAGVTVHGKLVELTDRNLDADGDADEARGFWGELRREGGEVWRVLFKSRDVDKVTPLFRKQAVITGTAVYFRFATPKILPESIAADTDRDIVAAFDELVGCYKGSITPEMIRAFQDGD